MTDVRLTATNPDDSSVVPVACNAKGELKLEEPTLNSDDYVAKAGDNMTGALTIGPEGGPAVATLSNDGSVQFAKHLYAGGAPNINSEEGEGFYTNAGATSLQRSGSVASSAGLLTGYHGKRQSFQIKVSGNADFRGALTAASVNGASIVLHLEADNPASYIVTTDAEGNETPVYNGPTLDVKQEFDLVEQALSEVMEKLRMTPPAGWPVWDGSDEDS